jgi:hypothetical protein
MVAAMLGHRRDAYATLDPATFTEDLKDPKENRYNRRRLENLFSLECRVALVRFGSAFSALTNPENQDAIDELRSTVS